MACTSRDPGNGISHYIHMERFGKPGQTMLGADSHTTQAGCLGHSRDRRRRAGRRGRARRSPVRDRLPRGRSRCTWRTTLNRPRVQAKDIILELLRRLTASGGKNKVLEFTGPGTADLSIPERATIANMVADLGGTAAVFPPDDRTKDWLERQDRADDFAELKPDPGACYDERIEIDLSELGPLVASPTTPTTWRPSRRSPAPRSRKSASAPRSTPAITTWRFQALCSRTTAARSSTRIAATTATPGSRQILAAIAESGVYRQLSDGGVRMLEPVCGPCVGMGQAPPSDANSLRTFNRNFPGRSGTAEDSVSLCSPAVAAVSLLSGKIADPREYGDAPELLRCRQLRPYVDDRPHLRPGSAEKRPRRSRSRGGRTSSARRSTRRCPTRCEARVATVQPDDISTGDLAPDGVEVMAYRSNVPAIAEFTFRHRDPEFRKRLKEWGSGLIVAGHNYGQGSSREHAALAPLQLGVKAVIAKSFARIHRRNLIAQGIVALTFADEGDYDKAEVGQTWSFPAIRQELEGRRREITAKIEDTGELHADPRLLRARARDPRRRRAALVPARGIAQRGATSSACVARPTRPRSS